MNRSLSRVVSSEERSVHVERRRFRAFLWAVAFFALLFLSIVQIVKQAHVPPNRPFINTSADAVLSEVLTAVFGTLLGSALVGILLDEYQRRFSGRLTRYEEFLENEGILAVYNSSQEPAMISALEKALGNARSRIVGVGLGLSVLMNRILLMRIAERLAAEKSVSVRVLLGSPSNAGVMNRVKEEEAWHTANGIAYDPSWPEYFPKEIRTILELHAGKQNQDRVQVLQLKSCPMFGFIKADDRTFLFLYGAPNMRGGSQSAWLELDASEKSGHLNTFVERCLEFFSAEADESLMSSGGTSV